MVKPAAEQPIGLFDSGVGGLSVWKAIRKALPHENLIYVADTAHSPYGEKSRHYIVDRALALTDYFRQRQVKAIVVPCNTATAAAISLLREQHPDVPFVGIEPAVKPAARLTMSGRVGVLATTGTLSSPRFRQLIKREAGTAEVILRPCPEWVAAVEAGHVNDEQARRVVQHALDPLLAADADVLVLGCTHFPFLMAPIRAHVGPSMPVIETGAAVAQQLRRKLAERGLLRRSDKAPADCEFWVSGDPEHLARVGGRLLRADPTPAWHSARREPSAHPNVHTEGQSASHSQNTELTVRALPERWR